MDYRKTPPFRRRMVASLRSLYRPRTDHFLLYVFSAAVVAAAGSILLLSLAVSIAQPPDTEQIGPAISEGWIDFIGMVVFAPVVESALLLLLLRLLSKTGAPPGLAAAISALIWGGLHGLLYPMWFFGTVWSFFMYSCAALAWWNNSTAHAFWAATLPHAMVNAAALFSVWFL